VDLHYNRNDLELKRGTFRVRGDQVDIIPAHEEFGVRVTFWGDEIEKITLFTAETGREIDTVSDYIVYPASHYVTTKDRLNDAIKQIREELAWRLEVLKKEEKYLEAKRLEQRTLFDLDMMAEIGYCSGIENYSRYLAGRKPGERPYCLFDYFPKDFVLIVDESHQTIPQINAMYGGDRARKITLVEHGFRLPSALDNRPLTFEEWESLVPQAIFVSATPGEYELEKSNGVVVEQIIRPTGLMEPQIIVRPVKNQIDDLLAEIRERIQKKERVLVLALTKRMSEEIADYLTGLGIRATYIHSELDVLERVEILYRYRKGDFDVLVGINLLREGIDIPELGLVAILDADKEGFLRSKTSLFQIAGRAARNAEGKVILYADKITDSMRALIEETDRRRTIQEAYNKEHGITPKTVFKEVKMMVDENMIAAGKAKNKRAREDAAKDLYKDESIEELLIAAEDGIHYKPNSAMKELVFKDKKALIANLKEQMFNAAKNLEFEEAARLRDQIARLEAE
jgi:excinuclease ABC subunit B